MTQFDTKLSTQISDQQLDLWTLQKSVKTLKQFSRHQLQPLPVLHWIGYGFLLLFAFDLIEILYPPQFMNPAWEFETIGQLVERVPVPLIGFVLVVIGGQSTRFRAERFFLKFLSWGTLMFALVFYLAIPLAIVDTLRLDQQLNTQVIAPIEQQMADVQSQAQTFKDQINQANTATDLQALLSQFELQAQMPDIQSDSQLETVKQQIAASLDNQVTGMENQVKTELANRRQQLWMRSVKWSLGALVSGTLFFLLWKETGWARSFR